MADVARRPGRCDGRLATAGPRDFVRAGQRLAACFRSGARRSAFPSRAEAHGLAWLADAGVNQALQWNYLAAAELGLGNTAQGLDALAKSKAVIKDSHDNVYGPIATEMIAALYAEARRSDLAVPLLAQALATPGIGAYYAPVLLWLDPAWDPIRHGSSFQALLRKYAKYKPAVMPVAETSISTAPAPALAAP